MPDNASLSGFWETPGKRYHTANLWFNSHFKSAKLSIGQDGLTAGGL